MSAIAAPFGLMPVLHPSGTIRQSVSGQDQANGGGNSIASGYATNIFQYAPVQIDPTTPSGNIIVAPAQGNNAASATTRMIGTMMGCEFTLTATGRRTVSNYWPANTVATKIVAWITRDSQIIYEIQGSGSILATQLGSQGSITANGSGNGNTTTGFSTVALDIATLIPNPPGAGTTATQQQLRIVGFSQRIDNAPGDAFTIVQVQISEHQDTANQIPY
jgi:hypothetical protein